MLDRRREVARLGLDGERVHELLEDAAAHRALGVAGEVHGDLGLDRLVGADAHEVDVDHVPFTGWRWSCAGDRELLGAVDAERDQRVHAAAARQDVHELALRTPTTETLSAPRP